MASSIYCNCNQTIIHPGISFPAFVVDFARKDGPVYYTEITQCRGIRFMRWRRRRYVSFIDFAASFHLTTCAGFWQYGTLQWDEFYNHLRLFIVTSTDWSIFQYEPTQ